MTIQSIPLFDLTGRVAVITGGGGMLGQQHAAALAAFGAIPVFVDIQIDQPHLAGDVLRQRFHAESIAIRCDITQEESVKVMVSQVIGHFGAVDILINNAANNPKIESAPTVEFSRFEHFSLSQWDADLAVGIKGAFLCSRECGTHMAQRGGGVILNIASDLGVIAPDQRIYRQEGVADDQQPVKPVTYSVVKTALLGLTRYVATYWADRNVRCNALSPGGVYSGQPDEFVRRLSNLIPLQRMARIDEYQGAVVFLCSDASSYMTGANLVVDGGRSCW